MTEAPADTAFLDANVLYPSLLRNILMRLALHGVFRARWSAQVHEEWVTALLRNRPDLRRERVEQVRDLMDMHIQDALVTAYEHHIPLVVLPDSNDRHVLAAAIHCGAKVIVTTNLRHFPASILAPRAIEARDPDGFILGLLQSAENQVISALRELRRSFKRPPLSADDLLDTMRRQGLTASANALDASVGIL